jgi:adenylosuccinate synthase
MSSAIILVGLGFGDEGKGTITDYLCRTRPGMMVARFCGGAQAAHNVVTDEGVHFCFHQFSSGTLAGAKTHLGPSMLVNPISLMLEEEQLRTRNIHDAWDKLTIDETCLITNPFHIAANRLREMARSGGRHGSCGLGINETVTDHLAIGDEHTIRAADLMDPGVLRKKLTVSWAHNLVKMTPIYAEMEPTYEVQRWWGVLNDRTQVDTIADVFLRVARLATIVDQNWWHRTVLPSDTDILFEGSQGVLLDEFKGFFPHVTRSRTTSANALSMLYPTGREVETWGVIRTYMTRHGAGPFPTEDPEQKFHEEHNRSGDPWQQTFRQGPFDLPLVRYAVKATGDVDKIVLTHMDAPVTRLCGAYKDAWFMNELPTNMTEQGDLAELVGRAEPIYEPADTADVLDALTDLAPVVITSSGPKPGSKHEPLK